MAVTLNVNGSSRSSPAAPDTPLLYVLRNDLNLNAAKYGCGFGQCGACTVMIDGVATRSCITPAGQVGAKAVTTLEGLGTVEKPHALQKAFIDEQAAQCGYCVAGAMMTAKALLDKTPKPDEGQIRSALTGNLCRCGTHNRIVRAIQRASGQQPTAGQEATA
jgi:nicotinate dehydrogenase subunit A